MSTSNWLFFLFLICYGLNLYYWVYFFAKLKSTKSIRDLDQGTEPLVSVIVVFKNDAQNLSKLMPRLLDQNYTNYELILMDDYSSDEFQKTLKPFLNQKKVNLYHAKTDRLGKKEALKEAIQLAQGEWILVTDADCQPPSGWIRTMMSHRAENTQMILGYSPYRRYPGWFNAFIRFEGVMTGVQYLSYVQRQKPYMGVGRNMAYTKSLYLANVEKARGKNIASGDDDLLVNAIKNTETIHTCVEQQCFVLSEPKQSFLEYIQQKRRHTSTAVYYGLQHQILLGLYAGSQIGTYGFGFICAFYYPLLIFLCWAIIIFIKMHYFRKATQALGDEDLWKLFPIFDLFQAIYYLMMSMIMILPSRKW